MLMSNMINDSKARYETAQAAQPHVTAWQHARVATPRRVAYHALHLCVSLATDRLAGVLRRPERGNCYKRDGALAADDHQALARDDPSCTRHTYTLTSI